MRVRLYVPEAESGKEIALTRDQIRHLKVLRLKEGDQIGIFDGKGHEYELIYSEKVRDGTVLLNKQITPREEPKTKITLATAVPKGSRMDFLIEKVSELGVNHIVPIICSRSVVIPRETKIERLRKIAIEACCQSERSIVPTLSEPLEFAKLLDTVKNYNKTYICHPTGDKIDELGTESVLIIIGPEGDFTPAELEAAKEAGCKKVRLGTTILRTETAAITAVAQIIGNIYK